MDTRSLICAAIFSVWTVQLFAASCESLTELKLPQTTIATAQLISGSFTPPGYPQPITNLPEFCRVAGTIKPSGDSDIKFEVWLPKSGWNGKFRGIGNGGFAGAISYGGAGLANAVSRGYASASTDTGHSVQGTDAKWALGHPEKITDYGHRAIHEMTVKAKAIVAAFYEKAPQHSYFSSCSNGGRQALMEVQRYPDDYDGVISGAPVYDFTNTIAGFIWNLQGLNKSDANHIPPSKMPAIEAAVSAQCDALDGVKDGVLDDPRQCKFDPNKMLCSGAETETCLTSSQIDALKKIYAGPQTSKGAIFPGFEPGGESGPGGWPAWITGKEDGSSLQYAFATQFLKNFVFQNSEYDYLSFNLDRDLHALHKLNPALNATDSNIKRFKDRGGKLILFHGWNDAALPARNTVRYYEAVKGSLGEKSVESFTRLYMVPGMQHCSAGPGPNSFGAYGEGKSEMMNALERWVEDGNAPMQIIATKYTKDGSAASGVVRTRPLCPYPQVARYKGSGSTDDAANFECRLP